MTQKTLENYIKGQERPIIRPTEPTIRQLEAYTSQREAEIRFYAEYSRIRGNKHDYEGRKR